MKAAAGSSSEAGLRARIDAACRLPEPESVGPLIDSASVEPAQSAQVGALARRLVMGIRQHSNRSGSVNALINEFSLSSDEGVALMCLAEALLRIPDRGTADRLIRDKLSHGDWRAHLGHNPSIFVNAAIWGLLITGRLVSTRSEAGFSAAVTHMLACGGEPLIRKGMDLAMRLLGEQFVAGRNIGAALERAHALAPRGYRHSFDMLGEAAVTDQDALRYLDAYREAAEAIGRDASGQGVARGNGMSVKLSALHPRYVWSQSDRVRDELLPRLKSICLIARAHDIGLNIDAEEASRLELSLDVFEQLVRDPDLAGWDGLGFVVQAYQKRAPLVVDWLITLAHDSGRRLMVRLVKGAYWDTEIKRAQVEGLADYPVFTRKAHTDLSWLCCAHKLLDARADVFPQFATHNARSLASVLAMAGPVFREGDYEFQCLHGMGEALYDQILDDPMLSRPVRIYAPVGSHETLLPYLVRRLLENGANSSFVSRVSDDRVAIEELIADPLPLAIAHQGSPHPAIPLPPRLYGSQRRNAMGHDLASPAVRETFTAAIEVSRSSRFRAAPAHGGGDASVGAAMAVCNPADQSDIVGTVVEAGEADVEAALVCAASEGMAWSACPAHDRANCLERAADLFEQSALQLAALAIREAGKSWTNAIAEVRESIDFLRYYAMQARRLSDALHRPLGPVVAISPWNFPLAIFTGQVSAALAAGNPVIAKPAEQTPLLAAQAVELLRQAGVPPAALQLLPGAGETVGAALVADPRVRAVLFTGSTAVASTINRSLAARGGDIVLIAETGGLNAMIVDSSALPEQVVADVLTSAFDSAGQRCSALRVLCVQEEVADAVVAMIVDACRELRLGDPASARTDIGPVIDRRAREELEAHVGAMREIGAKVHRPGACVGSERGWFVSPTIVEVQDFDAIRGEHFGPILHVVRYGTTELESLLDRINATGYGLTLGVHSRIDETIARVVERARVGNIYVNRNMIGAVVGVQPFGGEGLSGTGPKAGGPLYLHRLLSGGGCPDFRGIARELPRPAFDALVDWLADGARAYFDDATISRLREHADAYDARSPFGRVMSLSGPTGEENVLRFESLGVVAGVAQNLPAMVLQMLAAFSGGNDIALGSECAPEGFFAALPSAVARAIILSADWPKTGFEAVLVDHAEAETDRWRRTLALRDGPIVPVFVPLPLYDPCRLVRERAVSINTAAAGGDAGLLAMGG